jgi:hypothetical protein
VMHKNIYISGVFHMSPSLDPCGGHGVGLGPYGAGITSFVRTFFISDPSSHACMVSFTFRIQISVHFHFKEK